MCRLRRSRRSAAVALGLATVAASAMASTAEAFVERAPREFFGVNGQVLSHYAVPSADSALLGVHTQAISGLGAGWARVIVDWSGVEPSNPAGGSHNYQFGISDKVVGSLAQRGVSASLLLTGTPPWATTAEKRAACSNPSRAGPTDLDSFAAFAGATASRYGPNGSFWLAHPEIPYTPATTYEVWNEPNWTPFWCPAPEPAVFASLLAKSADAIHTAAPGTEVVLGGLAHVKEGDSTELGMETQEFLSSAMAARPTLAQKVDAIGAHVYGTTSEDDLALISWFRSILGDVGLGDKPIYFNEFGWPTRGSTTALADAARAQEIRALSHALWRSDCNIAGIAIHAWNTPEQNLLDSEDWFGIASPSTGVLYPAGTAYRDEISLARGQGTQPAPRKIVRICGGEIPDTDGDGVTNPADDYPLDPARDSGSGEVNPEDTIEPSEPEHPRRAPEGFFGVASGAAWGSDVFLGRSHYDAIAAAHLDRVRITVAWRAIEPVEPGAPNYRLNWNGLDSQVYAAAKRGLKPQLSMADPPPWAGSQSGQIATRYADFMGHLAKRYGRGGRFWRSYPALPSLPLTDYEVWFDGNWSGSWWDGSSSAAEYANAYAKTRAAVRAADPQALTFASLSGTGNGGDSWDFIPQLGTPIDGVHLNIYGQQRPQIESTLQRVRQALEASGAGDAPITAQLGYGTVGGGAITVAARADIYSTMPDMLARSDCGIEAVTVNAWTDAASGYGIAHPQTTELDASGAAFERVASAYGGWSAQEAPRATISLCGGPLPDRDGDGTPDQDDDYPLHAPPDSTITAGPARIGSNPTPMFSFESTDAGSTFACRIDQQAWTPCSSPWTTESLTDGSHEFEVLASGLGGDDLVSARLPFTVDTQAPETAISISQRDRRGPRVLTLESSENGSSFKCRMDGKRWSDCSRRYELKSKLSGRHKLEAVATDQAGNADPSRARFTFRRSR